MRNPETILWSSAAHLKTLAGLLENDPKSIKQIAKEIKREANDLAKLADDFAAYD